jgi:hypothetical protein
LRRARALDRGIASCPARAEVHGGHRLPEAGEAIE